MQNSAYEQMNDSKLLIPKLATVAPAFNFCSAAAKARMRRKFRPRADETENTRCYVRLLCKEILDFEHEMSSKNVNKKGKASQGETPLAVEIALNMLWAAPVGVRTLQDIMSLGTAPGTPLHEGMLCAYKHKHSTLSEEKFMRDRFEPNFKRNYYGGARNLVEGTHICCYWVILD